MTEPRAKILIEMPARSGRPGAIAEGLGRKILNGEIRPGDALPAETVLIAQWAVSRTTLREAFKLLTAKGLVDARPKRGTIVRPPEDWNLLDPDVLGWQLRADNLNEIVVELFEIRRIIEPEGAALAAAQADEAARDTLKRTFALLETHAGDEQDLEVDVAFHKAILAAAGNRFLRPLGTVIETALRTTVKLSLNRPGGLRFSLPQHKAVLDAILAQDPTTAREAMRILIENAQADALSVARALNQRKTG